MMWQILRLDYIQARPRFRGDQPPIEAVFCEGGPCVEAPDGEWAIALAKRLGFVSPILSKVEKEIEHA